VKGKKRAGRQRLQSFYFSEAENKNAERVGMDWKADLPRQRI